MQTKNKTEIPVPSKEEIERRFSELAQRGVMVTWTCAECGGPAKHRALPEERDRPDEQKVSICQGCVEEKLRY